jgi:hypothetical protein
VKSAEQGTTIFAKRDVGPEEEATGVAQHKAEFLTCRSFCYSSSMKHHSAMYSLLLFLVIGCKNNSSGNNDVAGSGGTVVDGGGGSTTDGSGGDGGGPAGDVYLHVEIEGDGLGSVEFGGVCADRICSRLVEVGESITLTPEAGKNSTFVGFSAEDCGATECTIVVIEATSITARFDMNHNVAFLTSVGYSGGQIGGLGGADELCADLADAAGFGDHGWKAWLSSSEEDAIERIPASARGWVRPDGLPAFDTLEEAVAGQLFYPLLVSENRELIDGAEVWTGTGTDGAVYPGGDDFTCSDWTSDSGEGQTGRAHSTSQLWATFIPLACEFPKGFYCLGTDRDEPVSVTEETGRIAFLSSAAFDAATGLTGADELCQNEADDATLPGTYRAFLATEETPAADRFDLEGDPWVRVDGLVWLDDPTKLNELSGAATPLNVRADGSAETGQELIYVFTGGTGTFGTGETATCDDWTANTDPAAAIMGGAQLAGSHSFTCCSGSCSNEFFPHHVYCLEE